EGKTKRARGAKGSIGDGLFQNLVVIFLRSDVRLKKHVGVRLNEAGHASAGDFHNFGAHDGSGTHVLDSVAFNNDLDIRTKCVRVSIPETLAVEDGRLRRRS